MPWGGIALTPTVVQAAPNSSVISTFAVQSDVKLKMASLSDDTGQTAFKLALSGVDPAHPDWGYTAPAMDEADQEQFMNEAVLFIEGTELGTLKDLGFTAMHFRESNKFSLTSKAGLKKLKPVVDGSNLDVVIKYSKFNGGQVRYPNMENNLSAQAKAEIKEGSTPAVVNKDALKAAITEGEAVDTTGKTDESAKALKDAIAAAKVIDAKADATQKEVDDAKAAIETAKAGLKDKPVTPVDPSEPSPVVVDLKDFTEYADAFYYTDKSIVDHLDNNIYLTTKAGMVGALGNIKKVLDGHNSFDILSIIGGVQAGVSLPIKDHENIRVGGFFEYDNKGFGNVSAHHIGLGATVKTEDVKAFVRYRVVTYKGKNNHNMDAYVNYAHNFVVTEKFHIEPSAGLYATYSSKVALDNDVELVGRFGVLGDASVKFAYVNDGLELYAKPELRFGYNNQMLRQTTVTNNQLAITRNYMNYSLGLGVNKTFKSGVKLFGQVKFEGDEQRNGELDARVGIGYSWK